ncbi:aspartate aminotransferase family protein [Brenneria goodwinii]|uniref:aspartate aminotransferase family protein n=1 Tax=Brenneria goodwinii TaxID=1109412 RepID=UPI0036E1E1D8
MPQSFSATAGMQNGFDISRLDELSQREKNIVTRRQKLLGPSYKLMYEHPVEFVRGEGVFLYDAEGNAYLDCYNNVPSVGHCNPAVVAAVSKQLAILNTHTRYMSEDILDYSEQLLNTFDSELGHVMYTCTGSEAVDLALRIAKFYTGGTGIIVTDYAYHGITTTVAAISTTMGEHVPVDQHVRTVRAPEAWRAGDGIDIAQRLADDIEAAIKDMQRHGIKFAGFIADSIFSTDGLLTEPAGFLKQALGVVHQYGGVYIADEVQPGFARTGSHMWGYQRHGIVPDLVVMGKPMGNGLPIAGVVANPELLDDFGRKVRYFNTFAGNPVCIAAAQAVLNEIQTKHLQENSRILGDYLLNGLRAIAENYPQIGDVRGAGLYHSVEFVKDAKSKEPDAEVTRKVVSELRERRVLISTTGKGENCLKIRPLLIFKQEHADKLLNTFEDTLKSIIG